MKQCLSDIELMEYLDGGSQEQHSHVDSCVQCRTLVVAFARSSEPAEFKSDRFELLSLRGSGSFGEVFVANDRTLKRQVALKVLHDDLGPTITRRFLKEAQVLARMEHKNVVRVFDMVKAGDKNAIVMELVDGKTLAEWAQHKRSLLEKKEVLKQIAEGLAYAHSKSILHRDIKPSNILLTEDGIVKLVDFGLTADQSESTVPPNDIDGMPLSQTGQLLGTPAYMAPELLAGGVASETTDQYSFSVLGWELLTGKQPTSASSLVALKRAREEKLPIPASSPRVLRVFHRGLSPQASDRWPSMAEVAETLGPKKTTKWWMIAAAAIAALAVGWGILSSPVDPQALAQEALNKTRASLTDPSASKLLMRWDAVPLSSQNATCLGNELEVARVISASTLSPGEKDTWFAKQVPESCVGEAAAVDAKSFAAFLNGRKVETSNPWVQGWALVSKAKAESVPTKQRAVYLQARRTLPAGSAPYYAATLELVKLAHQGNRFAEVRSLLNDVSVPQAAVFWQQRFDLERADSLLSFKEPQKARTILEKIGYLEKDVEPRKCTLLGEASRQQERYQEALIWHRRGLGLAKLQKHSPRELARHHHNIGGVLRELEEFREAAAEYKEALDLKESAKEKDINSIALTLNSLGALAMNEKRYAEAEAHFRRGWDYVVGTGVDEEVILAMNYGHVLIKRDSCQEALGHLNTARSMTLVSLGSDHPRIAQIDQLKAECDPPVLAPKKKKVLRSNTNATEARKAMQTPVTYAPDTRVKKPVRVASPESTKDPAQAAPPQPKKPAEIIYNPSSSGAPVTYGADTR